MGNSSYECLSAVLLSNKLCSAAIRKSLIDTSLYCSMTEVTLNS